jgi:hypothetical protein
VTPALPSDYDSEPDRDAVLRYCRSHSLHRDAADRVTPPVWLTKRGCIVSAYKQ